MSQSSDDAAKRETLQQAVQQQFGRAAAAYTSSAVHAQGEDLGLIVGATPLTDTMRVLDAGCGAGHTAFALAPHVREVVASDLTGAMLQQVRVNAAERELSNIRTQQGSVEALPFPAQTFDRVVSRYSAHHWQQPEIAVREFARVLKPGGSLILGDIVASETAALDTVLQTLEILRDPSHVRDHSVSQWQVMMRDAGFVPGAVQTFDLDLDFAAWVERIGTPETHINALRAFFSTLTAEAREHFRVPDDPMTRGNFSFRVRGAVMVATVL